MITYFFKTCKDLGKRSDDLSFRRPGNIEINLEMQHYITLLCDGDKIGDKTSWTLKTHCGSFCWPSTESPLGSRYRKDSLLSKATLMFFCCWYRYSFVHHHHHKIQHYHFPVTTTFQRLRSCGPHLLHFFQHILVSSWEEKVLWAFWWWPWGSVKN